MTFMGDSNYNHYRGGLTKYKENLLAVGGSDPSLGQVLGNKKTEIMKIEDNKNSSWSVVEPDIKFSQGEEIYSHSLVTVKSSGINEEYVLLIGGHFAWYLAIEDVFKFNGTWFPFGKLGEPRRYHNSIYWNGAVYVTGGWYENSTNTKMEIWKIEDSPDKFKTKENWPELFSWDKPHVFVVPDSFFPDY